MTQRIDGPSRDLGGFSVRRVLPHVHRRMVGPFAFFDEMGPIVFASDAGIDVRPHPHIGLSTVTYLFDGEVVHRDSLGSEQPIRPGDINWMTAGRGIVHSERSAAERRKAGARLHGLQLWVALPSEAEEIAPAFHHHPSATIPEREDGAVRLRVLAGSAYGLTSPVSTASPLFYVDVSLAAGASLALPPEHEERAAYIVEGAVHDGEERAAAGRLLVFDRDTTLRADGPARLVLIGGAPVGKRFVFWNFVSSSLDRIEQAKRDWRERRFAIVPGDGDEFIPLPE